VELNKLGFKVNRTTKSTTTGAIKPSLPAHSAAGLHLHFCNDSHDVISVKTDAEHTHTALNPGKITTEIKATIKKLYEMKLKPKAILREVNVAHGVLIKMAQLRNALQSIKKKACGGSISISVGVLEKWCIDNSEVPEDNEPFVVAHKFIYVDDDDESASEDEDEEQDFKFRFFMSSKKLLRLAIGSTHICADGTYKLNWHGFPLIVVGTTDLDRHFHSFGIAVCTNEKNLDYKFAFDCINIGKYI